MRLAFAIIVLSLWSNLGLARTWSISPDGTGDAPTIQAGMDSASAGDEVVLGCGTYYTFEIVLKAGVTLRSETGLWDCATIDGEDRGTLVIASDSDIGAETVVEGLTLQNGYSELGAGILCENGASPTIQDNRIRWIKSGEFAGAIFAQSSNPTIIGNVIEENVNINHYGCAIYLRHCGSNASLIEGNIIRNNIQQGGNAPAGIMLDASDPHITGNLIYGNRPNLSAILAWASSDPLVENNTILNNERGIVSVWNSNPQVRNNVVVGNPEYGIERASNSSMSVIGCNDVWSNGIDYQGCSPGTSDFSMNPLFCDSTSSDLTLRSDSPCLPGNHPDGADCDLIGAFGEGCSGPTAAEKTSWGGIKELFR